ncbi:hypothetical protein LG329_08895 [Virgibacillus necropolis]|uniref:hypothetical protein n=1 Tax=Virgibacillus necropolis TaxID=163877 RepID=UPI0038504378
MNKIILLSGIGIISGIIFGYVFKLIQSITGEMVYTLLLNVDYFPVIHTWNWNELTEFALHVCISIILVILLYYSLKHYNLHQKPSIYICINIIVGMLLWGTTVFSNRTPELMDGTAFSYWLIGHMLYGNIVGLSIKLVKD